MLSDELLVQIIRWLDTDTLMVIWTLYVNKDRMLWLDGGVMWRSYADGVRCWWDSCAPGDDDSGKG